MTNSEDDSVQKVSYSFTAMAQEDLLAFTFDRITEKYESEDTTSQKQIGGRLPGHFLVQAISQRRIQEAVNALKDPANRRFLMTSDSEGNTPLLLASVQGMGEMVKLLLLLGAPCGASNFAGNQPLHVAADEGHLEVVQYLLGAGADPDAENQLGLTAFDLASVKERDKVAELLRTVTRAKDAQQGSGSSGSAGTGTCAICYESDAVGRLVGLEGCEHACYCRECLTRYYELKVADGLVEDSDLACPYPGCACRARQSELKELLPSYVMRRFVRFRHLLRCRQDASIFWCPEPQCGHHVPRKDQESTALECPACRTSFCLRCRSYPFHTNSTCDEAAIAEQLLDFIDQKGPKIKKCAFCGEAVEKNDGCNHMTCICCKYQFCWLCSEPYKSDHYSNKRSCCFGLQFAKGDDLQEALLWKRNKTN